MSLRQSGGSERGAGAEGESSCEGRRKGNRGGGRGWSTLSHRRHGAGEAARGREKLGASFALAHLPIWKPPHCCWGAPGFGLGCRNWGAGSGPGGKRDGDCELRAWQGRRAAVAWLQGAFGDTPLAATRWDQTPPSAPQTPFPPATERDSHLCLLCNRAGASPLRPFPNQP